MRPIPDLGVYLHIPFCEKKCVYCDFYSLENMQHKEVFITMLNKEIVNGSTLHVQSLRPATSIFFGGGTPSLLTPMQIASIMETVRSTIPIHPHAEITMECNPGTITVNSLRGYKEAGINRLSFGIQSFHQEELDFLHRIHTPEDGKLAVQMAREAGFDNINIDLIFALPNQSIASWQFTLEQAIALHTEHISAYSLIFEEKTPLFAMLQKGLVKPQHDDIDADMYAMTIEQLSKAGYEQYEVSNFAKPHYQCIHNQTYWQAKEYLAFGPSAHGYIENKRHWNFRNLKRYLESVQLNGIGEASKEELSITNRLYESIFLGIRSSGVSHVNIMNRFGLDVHHLMQSTFESELLSEFFIIDRISDDTIYRLNSKGYAICDELSLRLITSMEQKLGISWQTQGYVEEDEPVFSLPII